MTAPTYAAAWSRVRLGDLIEEGPTNGYSPKCDEDAAGTPSLRLNAITSGRLEISERTTKRLNEEIPTNSKFWLRPGDLLVQRSNTAEYVGMSALFDGPPNFYVYADTIMRFRVRPAVEPRWIWRCLNSPEMRQVVRGLAAGTAGNMPKINGEKLRGVEIPLPPLPEQRRIADILDRADAVRRKRQEAIRLSQEFLRSTFLEMFGDPVTNPKGWPVVKMGTVTSFVGGGTPSRGNPDFFTGDICWATSKDMKGEHLWDTEEHITEEAIQRSATKLVPVGVLLVVVKSKVLMHTLPVLLARVPTCFGQDLKAIQPSSGLPPRYLARHMRVGASALLEVARGVNTEGLTLEHLRGYALMMPPRHFLEKYEEIEVAAEETIRRQRAAADAAQAMFDSLVHRAFRGELAAGGDGPAEVATRPPPTSMPVAPTKPQAVVRPPAPPVVIEDKPPREQLPLGFDQPVAAPPAGRSSGDTVLDAALALLRNAPGSLFARADFLACVRGLDEGRWQTVARQLDGHPDVERTGVKRATRYRWKPGNRDSSVPAPDSSPGPSLVLLDEPSRRVLAYLEQHPGWHATEALLAGAGLDGSLWSLSRRMLLEAGLVEKEGAGRGTRYRLLEVLDPMGDA